MSSGLDIPTVHSRYLVLRRLQLLAALLRTVSVDGVIMGKRKKAAKPMTTKKKEVLPTVFQCLFCNHEKSVHVRMDKKSGIGSIHCKVCGQQWSTNINFLSAPVDVYADWVDACDEAAKQAAAGVEGERSNYTSQAAPTPKTKSSTGGHGEMDDFIENDEMDAEADFADDD
ncbi:uncharacterized protein PV09_00280 [Verruconis gallopava]|uniref:Transcription elongation factor 1 homolog n=1 Tax=Verruconis gallopava TaxID=253628 RepID=A0A0D1Y2X9_9PEZI|nr:uncharacterized protein PV09_00280 [Verruconis gallopava]KIW09386.1 hypothetical protein PV09_00280 [Verruconis gallopava]